MSVVLLKNAHKHSDIVECGHSKKEATRASTALPLAFPPPPRSGSGFCVFYLLTVSALSSTKVRQELTSGARRRRVAASSTVHAQTGVSESRSQSRNPSSRPTTPKKSAAGRAGGGKGRRQRGRGERDRETSDAEREKTRGVTSSLTASTLQRTVCKARQARCARPPRRDTHFCLFSLLLLPPSPLFSSFLSLFFCFPLLLFFSSFSLLFFFFFSSSPILCFSLTCVERDDGGDREVVQAQRAAGDVGQDGAEDPRRGGGDHDRSVAARPRVVHALCVGWLVGQARPGSLLLTKRNER